MKYCSNCGTQLNDDARFCHACGQPQAVDPNPQAQPQPQPQPEFTPQPQPVNQPQETTFEASSEAGEVELCSWNNPNPQPQPQPQQMTIEEAVFGPQQQEHIPFEDEIKDEPVEEERSSDEIFESIFGNEHKEDDYTSVNIETEKAEDEPIGEYVPNKSNQRIVADDSEEEDNSATNIYFGGDDD